MTFGAIPPLNKTADRQPYCQTSRTRAISSSGMVRSSTDSRPLAGPVRGLHPSVPEPRVPASSTAGLPLTAAEPVPARALAHNIDRTRPGRDSITDRDNGPQFSGGRGFRPPQWVLSTIVRYPEIEPAAVPRSGGSRCPFPAGKERCFEYD